MTEHRSYHTLTRPRPPGDAAVDGLLAGAAAGLFMALYLSAVTLLDGNSLSNVFSRFAPRGETPVLTGALMHLAVSSMYGLVFGLLIWLAQLASRRRIPVVLAAVIYTLFLMTLALIVVLPRTHSAFLEFAHINLVLAHLIYGLVLGFLIRKQLNSVIL